MNGKFDYVSSDFLNLIKTKEEYASKLSEQGKRNIALENEIAVLTRINNYFESVLFSNQIEIGKCNKIIKAVQQAFELSVYGKDEALRLTLYKILYAPESITASYNLLKSVLDSDLKDVSFFMENIPFSEENKERMVMLFNSCQLNVNLYLKTWEKIWKQKK